MRFTHIASEAESVYHATDALTASKIKDFVKSPLLYHLKRTGMLPHATASASMRLGTLVHLAALEPTRWAHMVRTDGPINPKTEKPYGPETKAASDWMAGVQETGQNAATIAEEDQALSMAASVHDVCGQLGIPLNSSGPEDGNVFAESVIRGTMEGIGLVQCRPDLWDQRENIIYDLKTCDDVDAFKWSFRSFRYDIQAAWYTMLARELLGSAPAWRFLVVERSAPYRCRMYSADNRIMDAGTELQGILHHLKFCYETNKWPTDTAPASQELFPDE